MLLVEFRQERFEGQNVYNRRSDGLRHLRHEELADEERIAAVERAPYHVGGRFFLELERTHSPQGLLAPPFERGRILDQFEIVVVFASEAIHAAEKGAAAY